MFSVPFMCCEYRHVSLLTRSQPIRQATASCDSEFTRSKDALCIQPSAMEMSANTNMCEPCTNCWIVMQIDIDDSRNSDRFSVSFSCHSGGILHCYAGPLLMQPLIPYSKVSDHSVTVGMTNTMHLIGTPLVVTRCNNLIQSWRSWICYSQRCCDPHPFPCFNM